MLQKIKIYFHLVINFFHSCIKSVPVIGPLFTFEFKVIKKASAQLLILWVISSSPIILSITLDIFNGEKFKEAISNQINLGVIFIYTSSFLAPIVLMLISRVVYPREDKIFKGAMLIMLFSIFLLIVSAWAYGNPKLENVSQISLVSLMYFLSIYFWFLSIADNLKETIDYSGITDAETDDFINATRGQNHEK